MGSGMARTAALFALVAVVFSAACTKQTDEAPTPDKPAHVEDKPSAEPAEEPPKPNVIYVDGPMPTPDTV